MELKDIYQLWDRMENSSVNELELEMHGVRLVLKKGCEKNHPVVNAEPEWTLEEKSVTEKTATGKFAIEKTAGLQEANTTKIQAPLVGTFYQAPAPGEAPFVTVGQQVRKGDIVGFIEAMKLMNEITAPEDGIITAISVQDGDMVEFHQVLMELEI